MVENNRTAKDTAAENMTSGGREAGRARRVARRRKGPSPINVFDMIIVALVLAIVIGLVLLFGFGENIGGERGQTVKMTYELTLTNVDDNYAASINAGQFIYRDNGDLLGTVTGTPTRLPHTVPVVVGGQGTTATVPGKTDVTLTVTVEAVYRKEVGYLVDGEVLRIGDRCTVRLPGYTGEATCTAFGSILKIN